MEQCGTYVNESRVHGALQLTSHFRVHALAAVDVLCSATTGRRNAVDQRMRHVVADAEREAAHARLAGLAPDEVHDAAGVLHFAVGEQQHLARHRWVRGVREHVLQRRPDLGAAVVGLHVVHVRGRGSQRVAVVRLAGREQLREPGPEAHDLCRRRNHP